jgi:hypothetical protein
MVLSAFSPGTSEMASGTAGPGGSAQVSSFTSYHTGFIFPSVTAGLSIEYQFSAYWRCGLMLQYAYGLKTVRTQEISYSVNGAPFSNAVKTNTAEYFTWPCVRISAVVPKRSGT